jgi:hypothetical protein
MGLFCIIPGMAERFVQKSFLYLLNPATSGSSASSEAEEGNDEVPLLVDGATEHFDTKSFMRKSKHPYGKLTRQDEQHGKKRITKKDVLEKFNRWKNRNWWELEMKRHEETIRNYNDPDEADSG